MRSKRFTEEKIIGILKEYEASLAVNELGRKYGISNTIKRQSDYIEKKSYLYV
jgi:response regulator of citrate/malate metabolism